MAVDKTAKRTSRPAGKNDEISILGLDINQVVMGKIWKLQANGKTKVKGISSMDLDIGMSITTEPGGKPQEQDMQLEN